MIYLVSLIVISIIITACVKIFHEDNFLNDSEPYRFLGIIALSISWPLIIAIVVLALPAVITYCSPEIYKEFIKWFLRMNQERKLIKSANKILKR